MLRRHFVLLEEHGFEVYEKKGFYNDLIKFLNQAKTTELKTKHFKPTYNGTNVKVSFGQGYPARIPWISFLIEPHTTSHGIYPVYLFYKNINKLVLSFGVSETEKPLTNWNLSEALKLKDYFKKNSWPEPVRYGESFIYKVYDINNLSSSDIINKDLDDIILIYKNQISKLPSEPIKPLVINDGNERYVNNDPIIHKFSNSIQDAGLLFSNKLLYVLLLH
jgi:5-methylcytosine-specific restriction enzyme B